MARWAPETAGGSEGLDSVGDVVAGPGLAVRAGGLPDRLDDAAACAGVRAEAAEMTGLGGDDAAAGAGVGAVAGRWLM